MREIIPRLPAILQVSLVVLLSGCASSGYHASLRIDEPSGYETTLLGAFDGSIALIHGDPTKATLKVSNGRLSCAGTSNSGQFNTDMATNFVRHMFELTCEDGRTGTLVATINARPQGFGVVVNGTGVGALSDGSSLRATFGDSTYSLAFDSDPAPQTRPNQKDEEPREGSGSGFYVTTEGHIVTNAHVVEGCAKISLANGASLTLVDIDTGSDLALVQNIASPAVKALALRAGRGVRLAEDVIVAGYPLTELLSSGLNVTTGTVSSLAGPRDDRRRIQITAPVQPGNSGGPLLDSYGSVVGVVVSKLNALAVVELTGDIPQNVNFAVSLGTLQAFLDANSVPYKTQSSEFALSNADIAEMARSTTVQVQCRN